MSWNVKSNLHLARQTIRTLKERLNYGRTSIDTSDQSPSGLILDHPFFGSLALRLRLVEERHPDAVG